MANEIEKTRFSSILMQWGKYWTKVMIPVGSTSLASFIASEVAISWLAGEMANMMQLGCKKTDQFIAWSQYAAKPHAENWYKHIILMPTNQMGEYRPHILGHNTHVCNPTWPKNLHG